MPAYMLQHGKTDAVMTAQTAVGAAADFFAIPEYPYASPLQITWNISFPVAPATCTVKLEGCIGDPTVAANWFQLDTYTGIVAAMQHIVNKNVRFVRANIVTLTGALASVTVLVQI